MKHQGYAEAVLTLLKGKSVEVYDGSDGRYRKYSDFDFQQKAVIRGILKDGVGDLLIIEVTDKFGNTNDVYVNGWAVKSIVEPKNTISIIDVYTEEHRKQSK